MTRPNWTPAKTLDGADAYRRTDGVEVSGYTSFPGFRQRWRITRYLPSGMPVGEGDSYATAEAAMLAADKRLPMADDQRPFVPDSLAA